MVNYNPKKDLIYKHSIGSGFKNLDLSNIRVGLGFTVGDLNYLYPHFVGSILKPKIQSNIIKKDSYSSTNESLLL